VKRSPTTRVPLVHGESLVDQELRHRHMPTSRRLVQKVPATPLNTQHPPLGIAVHRHQEQEVPVEARPHKQVLHVLWAMDHAKLGDRTTARPQAHSRVMTIKDCRENSVEMLGEVDPVLTNEAFERPNRTPLRDQVVQLVPQSPHSVPLSLL
jgi:hypothetical protein